MNGCRTCTLTLASLLAWRTAALEIRGVIESNATWRLADSPVVLAENITISTNATVTIEPGVEVRLVGRVFVTVEGRIVAEGTQARPIRFVRHDSLPWRRLDFKPNPGESRFVWCEINGAGNTGNLRAAGTSLFLDHVTFTNTTSQLVSADDTSITVRNCVFPTITSDELLRFHGMPPFGHAVIEGCVFGTTTADLDILDVSGGKRPGPIVQILNNTFTGAGDDVLDLSGTDAHIEGNVFANVRQNAARPSTANAIATSAGPGPVSDLMVCRNIFYDVDHALLLRDGSRAVMQNNTIVTASDSQFETASLSVLNWAEAGLGSGPGGGCLFEGNLVTQAAPGRWALNLSDQPFTVSHSLLPEPWPGENNLSLADPRFIGGGEPTVDQLRSQLSLRPGSPARNAGPNGLDIGAIVPGGASVRGPEGGTTNRDAEVQIAGPGVVAFRWRLDGGPWSVEVPLTNGLAYQPGLFLLSGSGDTPGRVRLLNLPVGVHRVEAVGKNSAGIWQPESQATRSKSWIVRPEPLHVEMAALPGGKVRLRLVAVAGADYRILSGSILSGGGWTEVGATRTATATGPLELLLSATESTAFYQVVEGASD